MKLNYHAVGARIARRRKLLQLTQSKVAELCDISEQYPWLSTARKSFPTAQRRSNSTYYQNFSELQLETILAAHVQQAVLGVCSPEEALKQAQEDCNRYFQPW